MKSQSQRPNPITYQASTLISVVLLSASIAFSAQTAAADGGKGQKASPVVDAKKAEGPETPSIKGAEQLAARGRWKEALEFYNQAIKINSKDGTYFFKRALAYIGLHETEKAIADFHQAATLKPKWAPPFYQMGILHQKEMEDELALDDFNHAVADDPKDAMSFRLRATSYQSLGKYDLAIGDLNHFIVLAPGCDNSDHQRFLGQLYLQAGQPAKAIEHLKLAIARNPTIHTVHKQLGDANAQLKNYKVAIEEYSLALKKLPTPELYRKRADAYRHSGQKALADLDEAQARSIGNAAFEEAPFRSGAKEH